MAWKSTSGRGTTGTGQRLMKTITDGDIDGDDFGLVAEPFRRELVAYGYRMLGSVDDAEEIVQDVYLEAWRAYERFEARSSVRTWLYRIATRAFVKAVARRNRRPLPSDLSAPAANPGVAIRAASPEITWLQPAPDSLLAGTLEDPAGVVVARETTRLAFVAAMQVRFFPRARGRCSFCVTCCSGAHQKSRLCWMSAWRRSTVRCSGRVRVFPPITTLWSNRPSRDSERCSTDTWRHSKMPTSKPWSRS